MPGWQLIYQEDPFQRRDIFADGGPAHLEGGRPDHHWGQLKGFGSAI